MQLGTLLAGFNPIETALDAVARFLFFIWTGFAQLANFFEGVFRQLAGIERVRVETPRAG